MTAFYCEKIDYWFGSERRQKWQGGMGEWNVGTEGKGGMVAITAEPRLD